MVINDEVACNQSRAREVNSVNVISTYDLRDINQLVAKIKKWEI
jgi:hypothetical protein